jgi:predicted N-acetyltransferase YhbS
MTDFPLSEVEKLAAGHDLTQFQCKKRSLEAWLRRHALKNQILDSSQTYVVHRGGRVVGYYALTYGEVQLADCPPAISEGMPPRFAVPVVLLARLAVDDREAGRGLGGELLKDALTRTVNAADIAGAKAVLVDAIDDEARSFYKHFGFEETPVEPLKLMKRIVDIRASMRINK